jgi:acrylyl-CoA reductase (NADPH)
MPDTFRGLLATSENKQFAASIQDIAFDRLPPGEVLIRVSHSSLNYKDGLAVTGAPGVIRQFPMIPGVDLAGTVEESASAQFKPGDAVVVTGCGTSETIWGGYAEYARLSAEHIVPLPAAFTPVQAMGIGTAGFTAMQCVMALEAHSVQPGKEVVVSGAGGGVGSVAIAILAKLGYKPVASTGRATIHDYLRSLGAADIIDRAVLSTPSKRPMDAERWSGAVDTVGGETLAGIIRTMAHSGTITACGVAGGHAVSTTVFPFILRGVNLLGIDSVRTNNAQRREIWQRLSTDLDRALLDQMIDIHPWEEVFDLGAKILKGEVRGRTVLEIR